MGFRMAIAYLLRQPNHAFVSADTKLHPGRIRQKHRKTIWKARCNRWCRDWGNWNWHLVAEYMGLPFVYVRPEPKKHGRQNQIEGFLQKGQNVVVVEDLISTGKSSLQAVDALKEAGANVKGMVAIFTYGFEVSAENFKNAKVELCTLSNYQNLLSLAVAKKYITEEEQQTLQTWSQNPATWNAEPTL